MRPSPNVKHQRCYREYTRLAEWVCVLSALHIAICFGCTKKGTAKQQRVMSDIDASTFYGTLRTVRPEDLATEEVATRGGVPLLLHQSHKSLDAIPNRLKQWMHSWEKSYEKTPGWRHVFWTDADNEELIRSELPWMLDTYKRYPHYIQRADIARMAVLLKYGGVYADGDYECLKPECMGIVHRANCSVYLVGSSNITINGFFMNSLMASRTDAPAKAYWRKALSIAHHSAESRAVSSWLGMVGQWAVLTTTGPGLLSLAYGGQHGLDVDSAKGKYFNFDEPLFVDLFQKAGLLPKESNAEVCSLEEAVYNGQGLDVPAETQMTHHHNAGTWVKNVYYTSTHMPRLLPVLVSFVPPVLLSPALGYAAVSAVFCLVASYPGSPLEILVGVVFVGALLALDAYVPQIRTARTVYANRVLPCVYVYAFLTFAYLKWVL